LFSNRVRGYRKVTTKTTVQPTVQPITTTVHPVTTTTKTVLPTSGYRFNYIEPKERDHPTIFASRTE
jgi:hypothetical protein